MPRGTEPAPPRTETPADLREMATRVRRLALGLDELTIRRLNKFPEELEARAADLEQGEQIVTHSDAAMMRRSDPDIG